MHKRYGKLEKWFNAIHDWPNCKRAFWAIAKIIIFSESTLLQTVPYGRIKSVFFFDMLCKIMTGTYGVGHILHWNDRNLSEFPEDLKRHRDQVHQLYIKNNFIEILVSGIRNQLNVFNFHCFVFIARAWFTQYTIIGFSFRGARRVNSHNIVNHSQ